MSRYLTPAKIGLLVLGLIYHEGDVPTSECTAVLAFIIANILPDAKHAPVPTEETDLILPITAFETALSKHGSVMPGRTIYDRFVGRLWMIDCSDALDNFFTTIPCLLAKSREMILRERESGMAMAEGTYGKYLRTSPLGAFIRRCHLEYTRLQFQDAISLWQDLIAWRASTRQAYEKKNSSASSNALDINLSTLDINSDHPLAQVMYAQLATDPSEPSPHHSFSTHDIDKLLEFQVSEMQRLGSRLPPNIYSVLSQMSRSGHSTPKLAHYLKFLDSWRSGTYNVAFDSLHRYFDYTMQSRDRTFYQYALLNLAILQADFGCYAEAIPAMQEAIATARENKDTTCLNFCMSWLYHFGRTCPSEMKNIKESGILGSEIEGLQFLKARARDAEMWSLLSTSLLSEAKLGLQHGDSLAIVFENIAKASHINVTKGVGNVAGPTLLMRASTFTRVGLTHLAWSCSETFLECYRKDAPIEDVLKCTCRMASILTQRGRYTEAEDMMANIDPSILRVLKYNNYSMYYNGLLKLRRFIHHGDIRAADYILNKLKGQGPPDLEIGMSLSFLELELYLRSEDLEGALKLLPKLADKAELESNDVSTHVRLMNIKARVWAIAGKPLKGFSVVMKAAQMAYQARVLPCLWESVIILANVLGALREWKAVIDLLGAVMPMVLEGEDCETVARGYVGLADGWMGRAGEIGEDVEKMDEEEREREEEGTEAQELRRKEYVGKAMGYLDSALQQWKFVEDLQGQLDCLQKRAKIMKWRGDDQLAEAEAAKYLEIKRDYQNSWL